MSTAICGNLRRDGLRRVSLLVMAAEGGAIEPQALPRVTVRGDALPLARDADDYAAARAAYLARFPNAAQRCSSSATFPCS